MNNRIVIYFVAVLVIVSMLYYPEIKACSCTGMYLGPSIEGALNDSLLENQKPDSSWLNMLKDSVAASKSSFIGTFEKITVDPSASIPTEILLIRKEKTIKGQAIHDTFTVVNHLGMCITWSAPLLGKKFLCILGKDTIPKDFYSLGVNVRECGGFSGILVTQNHFVTLGDTCVLSCWSFLRQISLQSFIDAVSSSVHAPIARGIVQKTGTQVEEMYFVNGRRLNCGLFDSRVGRQILIHKDRLGVMKIVQPCWR